MAINEIYFVLRWWLMLLGIGFIFYPFTSLLFRNFIDKGYIFSKIIGIALASYAIFILGIVRILPFSFSSIYILLLLALVCNAYLYYRKYTHINKRLLKIFLVEELFFFLALLAWSYIRGNQPDINGLEKFMDFGFVNSILRADFFPPKDIWYANEPINYYYFGHFVTALLTKLSGIKSAIAYNLMIATIFAFSFVSVFSLAVNIIRPILTRNSKYLLFGGLLSAILVTLAGNLQTIYSLFTSFNSENPLPFWTLPFSPGTFPNSYWYPNATRFIPFTIHEFPLYSYIVADLHGHVSDMLFVFLSISLIYSFFTDNDSKFKILKLIFLSFLLSLMYMTNAWDGMIYMTLAALIFLFLNLTTRIRNKHHHKPLLINGALELGNYRLDLKKLLSSMFILLAGFVLFSLPFNVNFKPFVSGIGIICAPDFLTKMGSLGPFLFEPNHCARSPFWQLLILYGFFFFSISAFITFIAIRKPKHNNTDIFVLLLIVMSLLLLLAPEFIYVKDIYPAHYRANTMFKLAYQAFIMLSISSGYIFMRIIFYPQQKFINRFSIIYVLLFVIFFSFIMHYPNFGVNSYYGDLKNYKGLDGISYLQNSHPFDYTAIEWINKNIERQPVMLEAQGDSYTDYERISANTGLPTILGWTVHEWLWRGTYEIVSPRIEEVKQIYESNDIDQVIPILKKYNVSYVYIGGLEREKYPGLEENKFKEIGKVVYENAQTKIYKIEKEF